MAKKCYAVRRGYTPGIFYSWADCQKSINGFSGAEFKGFDSDEDAYRYLKGGSSSGKAKISKPTTKYSVNLYTDGSYKEGDVSFGVYMETMDRTFGFHGVVSCKKYESINNVASEIFAVLVAVELAIDMGYTTLNIIYDYKGLECWYNGSWECKGELQQLYVALLNNLRLNNNLDYNFIKVKGHSGLRGNEKADKLALRGRTFKDYIDMDLILRGILTVRDVPLFNI